MRIGVAMLAALAMIIAFHGVANADDPRFSVPFADGKTALTFSFDHYQGDTSNNISFATDAITYDEHRGTDFALDLYTPVYAAASGQ